MKSSNVRAFRGDRLKAIRELRGLTQSDIEERLKIGPNQMSRYENGLSEPKPSILKALAALLEVSTDYLLGLVDEKHDHLIEEELSEEERKLIAAYRRKDFKEVVRLAAEKS